jgi:5-methylcytosine-specific restriction endonuclease McrA
VPTPTDRTPEPTALRVTLSTDAATGTVPIGPSASENADGPGSLPTTGAISRHARVTEKFRHDSEVTAVSHQRTRTPSTRDSGTPHAAQVRGVVPHAKPSKRRMRETRLAVFTRDDWTCQYCGRRIEPKHDNERTGEFAPLDGEDFLELDHITPRAAGGLFMVDNLRAACSPCNRTKSAVTAFADWPARVARAIDILQRRTANPETARAAIEALTGVAV